MGSRVPATEWIEREIHELLGVEFRNHPDMRHLLLADDWPADNHPLRKDWKVEMLNDVDRKEQEAHHG